MSLNVFFSNPLYSRVSKIHLQLYQIDGLLSIHFGYYSHQSWNVTTTSNGTQQVQDTCQNFPYDMTPPDTTFKVGRAFNLLTMILGASFLFMDILTGCASTNPKKSVRQSSGVGYILVALCSGLSLLIFQVSAHTCLACFLGLNYITAQFFWHIEYGLHKQ